MDVRQLRYFVQIVESGSLSKASRQLCIVQPALSQRMARLEAEVGKPLLVRSPQGVTPTESGQLLYHHARFILRQLDEAVLVARQQTGDVRGRVALGLAPSTSSIVGLPLLKRLKEKYPGILLNVVVALPGHLEERARQGQLDAAVLFSRTAASELDFEPLLREEVFVVLPRQSPLVPCDRTSLRLAELAALPLVVSSPEHNLRRKIMAEFERLGLEPTVVAEIDSLELVMRYVAEGAGLTIQPMAATELVAVPGGWRCLEMADAPMSRPNYLYALPARTLSASAAVVRAELKLLVGELIATGQWAGVRRLPDVAG